MVVRFGVALPEDLAKKIERIVHEFGYGSRSQFVSEAIRVYSSMLSLLFSRENLAGIVVVILKPGQDKPLTHILSLDNEVVSSIHVARASPRHVIASIYVHGPSAGIRSLVESLRKLREVVNVIPLLVPVEE